MAGEFVTKLGCRIRVIPAAMIGKDHDEGSMLVLDMDAANDPRYAEVFLTPENAASLRQILPADEGRPLQVGDRVENILNPSLDHRRVIGVIEDSILLDFQKAELDRGELPTRLPMSNYRRVQ